MKFITIKSCECCPYKSGFGYKEYYCSKLVFFNIRGIPIIEPSPPVIPDSGIREDCPLEDYKED